MLFRSSTKDEINRVEHFYLLLFDVSKMFLENSIIINQKSKYINNEKLKNTLSSMQKLSVNDDLLDEIMVSFLILVMLKELRLSIHRKKYKKPVLKKLNISDTKSGREISNKEAGAKWRPS